MFLRLPIVVGACLSGYAAFINFAYMGGSSPGSDWDGSGGNCEFCGELVDEDFPERNTFNFQLDFFFDGEFCDKFKSLPVDGGGFPEGLGFNFFKNFE